MATILRGSYNIDQIEALANLIKDNAGFSGTDFSVSGVYDFIVNSKAKLRLKAASATNPGLFAVANGVETSIAANTYLNIRMVVTEKATAIGVYPYTAAADVQPSAISIIRAQSKSTHDNDVDDIMLFSTNGISAKFYAPDMIAFTASDTMGAAPTTNTSVCNTILYKVSGNTTYYIPESVYFIRATNAAVGTNYYNFTLVNNVFETVGYWALRDDEA